MPTSFDSAAIYFRHDISTGESVYFVIGDRLQEVSSALQQRFRSPSTTSNHVIRGSASPLQVISVLVSEYMAFLKTALRNKDDRVGELEAKTGMSALRFDESQRAAATEHNSLLKNLHVCESGLGFLERTAQFQVRWIEWLQSQHAALNRLRFGTCEIISIAPADVQVEEEIVASSLSLHASFSSGQLEEIRTLRNRTRIQLSVVSPPWRNALPNES